MMPPTTAWASRPKWHCSWIAPRPTSPIQDQCTTACRRYPSCPTESAWKLNAVCGGGTHVLCAHTLGATALREQRQSDISGKIALLCQGHARNDPWGVLHPHRLGLECCAPDRGRKVVHPCTIAADGGLQPPCAHNGLRSEPWCNDVLQQRRLTTACSRWWQVNVWQGQLWKAMKGDRRQRQAAASTTMAIN
jgi:hypothetical protein